MIGNTYSKGDFTCMLESFFTSASCLPSVMECIFPCSPVNLLVIETLAVVSILLSQILNQCLVGRRKRFSNYTNVFKSLISEIRSKISEPDQNSNFED